MNLYFIITMAGFGSRFRDAGYSCPKYRIVVKSKTLFAWAMLSLQPWFQEATFVFVMRRDDKAELFVRNECERLGVKIGDLVSLDAPTNGQATTAMLALDRCRGAGAVAIYNIDTHLTPGIMQLPASTENTAGFIPAFRASGTHWSFVALGQEDRVQAVAEKRRISPFATVGLYWFSSGDLFRESYFATFPEGLLPESLREAYVAPMYQHLLDRKLSVRSCILPSAAVQALGTPLEVEDFARSDYNLPTR